MSEFNFRIDISKARAKLKRSLNAFSLVPQAMQRGGLFFIADIQEKWYTGRKGNDMGLNIGEERLRESWFPDVIVQGTETIVRVINDVIYGRVHEFGSPKQNIPKRTDVVKDWENEGRDILKKEIEKVL